MTAQKYHIVTFGCQMNKADSERMAGVLEDMGYQSTDESEEADLILYNTCSIRDNAEHNLSERQDICHLFGQRQKKQWL